MPLNSIPNPAILTAIETLGYRVTVGDVATQAGLNVAQVEQGLLALASDTGGHLQVTETGDLVYLFPQDLRGVLRSRSLRLRLKQWWDQIWKVLFYLIRISFGILLIASIVLIFLAIAIIAISASSRDDNDRGGRDGGGTIFMPHFSLFDWFYIFDFSSSTYEEKRRRAPSEMNFLEAVFSFLFGDGNPNADLEERRWQAIAAVIATNHGAVIAEQIAPYVDELGADPANEDYMLPVLLRFNGKPEVSPAGELIYRFPELQVRAAQQEFSPAMRGQLPAYLQESRWKFSHAETGQLVMAGGLGVLNLVGAIILGRLLGDGTIAATLGGLVGFVGGIYGLLLAYGTAFLAVPAGRSLWLRSYNAKVERRNQQRQARSSALQRLRSKLQPKLDFAQQFAQTQTIQATDLAYTTETDLSEQEAANPDRVDAEWQRRLESGSSGSSGSPSIPPELR